MKVSREFLGRALVRWIVGAVLIWASLGKLANLQEFYGALLGYRLPLPAAWLRFAALVLPWLELICGLLLWRDRNSRAALGWAAALFAIFSLATLQAWWRGLAIGCGCLDLRLVGLAPGSAATAWLESARFAFFRAAALFAATLFLLRSRPDPDPV